MAEELTGYDSLRLHLAFDHTGTDDQIAANSLGGAISAREVARSAGEITGTLLSVAVTQISGNSGTGTAYITAASATTLTYTAPGDTAGAAVTIAEGETKVLYSNNTTKWCRVYRDQDGADLDGVLEIALDRVHNNFIGMRDLVLETGTNYYRAGFLVNYSDKPITNVKVYNAALGTQQVSDVTPMDASGSVDLETSGSFADWPQSGWVLVRSSGGTLREVAQYRDRTDTVLEIHKRAVYGTTQAGATDDTITPVCPLAYGYETPDSDGLIQTVASDTTAPSGITWQYSDSASDTTAISTIGHNKAHGLWLRINSNADGSGQYFTDVAAQNKTIIQWDYDGTTYTDTISGYYRYYYLLLPGGADTYRVYIGEDALPDFSTPTVESNNNFVTSSVTPPVSGTKDIYIGAQEANEYLLWSQNTDHTLITIDSAGNDVTKVLTTPNGVTLTAKPAGEVLLEAHYNSGVDASPADTFNVYIRTDGTDPDITTDTPTQYTIGTLGATGDIDGSVPVGSVSGTKFLSEIIGPYDWGTDLRAIVTVERSSDSEESAGSPVSQLTITDTVLGVPGMCSVLSGDKYTNAPGVLMFDQTVTIGSGVYFRLIPGETQFWSGSTLIWRALWLSSGLSRLYIDDSWALSNVTHSAAGSSDDVEVVSANEIYLNVNSTRRAKIDVTAKTIEADAFEVWDGVLTYETRAGSGFPATGSTASTMWTQVYDPSAGVLREYIELDTTGKFLTESPIIQELS